jgi:hypothetical protein
MANKKITFELDINGKPIDVVIDKTLNLKQAARELTKELNRTKEGTKEFELLSSALGGVQDKIATTNVKSRDLFASFSLIPGPIGEIAGKLNGAIGLMKTFTSFSLSDLKFQLGETIDDFKDIAVNIGKATGLTKLWQTTVGGLTNLFKLLPISMNAATIAAKSLAAAIAATGVGLLVVGISTLIGKIMEWTSSTNKAEAAQKRLADSIALVSTRLDQQREALADQTELNVLQAKAAGKSEDELLRIRKEGITKQIAIDKLAISSKGEFAKEELKIALDSKTTEVEKQKLYDELLKKRNEANDRIYKGNIQLQKLDLEATIASNDKLKGQGEKSLATAKKLAEDILNQKKEAINQFKDALEQQIQNEVDAENTSAAKLKPLIDRRIKAENEELDKAKKILDQQLKDKIITQEQFNVISEGIEAKRLSIVVKYKNLVDKALEEDAKKVEDKKKEREEEIKDIEDFNKRIAEIRITAIKDDTARNKEERTNKYNNELTELEKDKNFILLSETEKGEVRKNLKTALNNDLQAIDDKAKETAKEKEQKGFDDKLRLLELQSQGLYAGTQAYFDNRQTLLDTAMAKELAAVEKGGADELAIKSKYAKLQKQLDDEKIAATGKVISATLDSFAAVGNALASSYDEEAKTSEDAFNKRKKLQKATALMSAASGLVQILTQPSTLPSPFDWIVKSVNAIALGIATATNIKKIDQTQFSSPAGGSGGAGNNSSTTPQPINVVASRASGGIVMGQGTSTSDSITTRLSNGEFVVNAKATQAFLPLLNSMNDAGLQPQFSMGQMGSAADSNFDMSQSLTNAIASSISERPIRTYVVGTDMSNQQQMDRIIKSRSLV